MVRRSPENPTQRDSERHERVSQRRRNVEWQVEALRVLKDLVRDNKLTTNAAGDIFKKRFNPRTKWGDENPVDWFNKKITHARMTPDEQLVARGNASHIGTSGKKTRMAKVNPAALPVVAAAEAAVEKANAKAYKYRSRKSYQKAAKLGVKRFGSYGRGGVPTSVKLQRIEAESVRRSFSIEKVMSHVSWSFKGKNGEWQVRKSSGKVVEDPTGLKRAEAEFRHEWWKRAPITKQEAKDIKGLSIEQDVGHTRYKERPHYERPGRKEKLTKERHVIATEMVQHVYKDLVEKGAKVYPILMQASRDTKQSHRANVIGTRTEIGTVRIVFPDGTVKHEKLTGYAPGGRDWKELLAPFMVKESWTKRSWMEGVGISGGEMSVGQAADVLDMLVAIGDPDYRPPNAPRRGSSAVAGWMGEAGGVKGMVHMGGSLLRDIGENAVTIVQEAIIGREYGFTLSSKWVKYREKMLRHGTMHKSGKTWFHDFPSRKEGSKIPVHGVTGKVAEITTDPTHPLLWTGTLVNSITSEVSYTTRSVLYGIFKTNQMIHPVTGDQMYDVARYVLKNFNFLAHQKVLGKVRQMAKDTIIKYINDVIHGGKEITHKTEAILDEADKKQEEEFESVFDKMAKGGEFNEATGDWEVK